MSDNVKTPGLKLWTFGPQSLSVDINNSAEWLRPTIEMWHGITPEFWMRGSMAANEVRQWNQTFFPILGLKGITAASENGALYLSSAKSGSDTVLSVAATLTLPNQTVKAVLRLNGTAVAEQDVVVAATGRNHRERDRGEQPGSRRSRLRGRFPAGRPKPAGRTNDPAIVRAANARLRRPPADSKRRRQALPAHQILPSNPQSP